MPTNQENGIKINNKEYTSRNALILLCENQEKWNQEQHQEIAIKKRSDLDFLQSRQECVPCLICGVFLFFTRAFLSLSETCTLNSFGK